MNYQRFYLYIIPILIFSFLYTPLLCQEVSINSAAVKFETVQDATKIDEYCYQLTGNKEKAGGALWYPETIDLREDFFMDLNLFLGCDDSLGADGIVLMFCKNKILGGKGAGMGYLNLKPSLGIEFDTYQNIQFGDPQEDHIAVLENGAINHRAQLYKPIALEKNIEDCDYHSVVLEWNATQFLLTITLDGKQLIQYEKDIIQKIFGGAHRVYWGISAATGSDHNSHKVCFNNLEMTPAGIIHQFSKTVENKLKRGNFIALDELAFNGDDLIFNTTTKVELEKLLNFLKNNNTKNLDIFSHVHDSTDDENLSIRRARALKNFLVDKGIKEDRLIPKGVGSQYVRSTRDLKKGLSNTRIEIYLFEPLP